MVRKIKKSEKGVFKSKICKVRVPPPRPKKNTMFRFYKRILMLVNFLRRIGFSGVKIHILTNFHYSRINIVVNIWFRLLTLPIGTAVSWTRQNLSGDAT